MDKRIGSKFLHAGPGYGGSCFPKDTQALVKIGDENYCNLSIIKSTIDANKKQKIRMVEKIVSTMREVDGKTFAILGLAFKPNTDDMRDAHALTILNELAKFDVKFKVYR